jgi:UDP-N-acetylmuramoyl-L-alanyl-D-glutamate--2,6-diaminopimelate ligase
VTDILHSPEAVVHWLRQHQVRGLVADSRHLQPGQAFVAWPGAAHDGRRFVKPALAAGASACLVEAEGLDAWAFTDARIAAVPGLKALAGPVASLFHGQPSARLHTVAVTGTNGKTSIAWWAAQWLNAVGVPAAMVGTLGHGVPGQALHPTGLTTPDPVTLQQRLTDFAEGGLRACVMEASSIGLEEGRLAGLALHTAVFTNLTQDHLDYHGSMAAYWAAKRALFDWPGLQAAVVNVDDAHGAALARDLSVRAREGGFDLWTVSTAATDATTQASAVAARLRLVHKGWTDSGQHFTVQEAGGARVELHLNVVGDYNLNNLVCVMAVLRAHGHSLEAIAAGAQAMTPVPGRMHAAWIDAPSDLPLVLVDYAHTPDALEKALQALQPLAAERGGRLWCVVGCGGDRDKTKRPLMAAAAEREAARLVLTSDNPRSEDAMQILWDMQTGLSEPVRAVVEPDRALAIAQAVAQADDRDVILLAGKGHETYQEVAGVKHPFSDLTEGRAALLQRFNAQGGAA